MDREVLRYPGDGVKQLLDDFQKLVHKVTDGLESVFSLAILRMVHMPEPL